MTQTYDSKCEDLARASLAVCPELDANKLAPILSAEIQQTIEDFIEGERMPPKIFDLSLLRGRQNVGE